VLIIAMALLAVSALGLALSAGAGDATDPPGQGSPSAGAAGLSDFIGAASEKRTLKIIAVPEGSGSFEYSVAGVAGAFAYEGPVELPRGSKVTIAASSAESYSFSLWATGLGWAQSPVSGELILDDDSTVCAVFSDQSSHRLKLTESPAGSGAFLLDIAVTNGAWIAKGVPYAPSDPSAGILLPGGIYARATPAADEESGYLFDSWAARYDNSQDSRATFKMDADREAAASFVKGSRITAASHPASGGSFEFSTDGGYSYSPASGITVLDGTRVHVRAVASQGYAFSLWLGIGDYEDVAVTAGGDTEMEAYFAKASESHTVTVAATVGGRVDISINDLPTATPVIPGSVDKVLLTRGDSITLSAVDLSGRYSMFAGTENVFDPVREISIQGIDRDWDEAAYFSSAADTYELSVKVEGGGRAGVSVPGWGVLYATPSKEVRLRVDRDSPASVEAADAAGLFQNMKAVHGSASYVHERSYSIAPGASGSYELTVRFTQGRDVYTVDMQTTESGFATYSLGGSEAFEVTGEYALKVDRGVATVLSQRENAGYFRQFVLDDAESFPGPSLTLDDDADHFVQALFTANKVDVYAVKVRIHGTGVARLSTSSYPDESVEGPRDLYVNLNSSFSVAYESILHKFQYASLTADGGQPENDFMGDGFSRGASAAGTEYVLDIYYADQADGFLYLSATGAGYITLSLNGGDPVRYGGQVPRAMPMDDDDVAVIGRYGGNFKYFSVSDGVSEPSVVLSDTVPVSSLSGYLSIDAAFAIAASPNYLTLATEGAGQITFRFGDGPVGAYSSPSPGASRAIPMDADESVEMGYVEDGCRFQYLVLDGEFAFDFPGAPSARVSGSGSHSAKAYFTETADTYSIYISSAGSGQIVVTDQWGNRLSHSGYAAEIEICADSDKPMAVDALEAGGYFQYFRLDWAEGQSERSAVAKGDASSPPGVTGFATGPSYDGKRVRALFTDTFDEVYLVDMSVEGSGALRFQIGGDPWAEMDRGSPWSLYIDPHESIHFDYDESGPSDGYFQTYRLKSAGTDILAISPQRLSDQIRDSVEAGASSFEVKAHFTAAKDPASVHRVDVSTEGIGSVEFSFGGLIGYAAGQYSGPPRAFWLDDGSGFSAGESYGNLVLFRLDGSDVHDATVSIAGDGDHELVAVFEEEYAGDIFTLHVKIYGDGEAAFSNGTLSSPIGAGRASGISEYTLQAHAGSNATITAVAHADGRFQGIVDRNGSWMDGYATGGAGTYAMPAGTVAPGSDVYVEIYFTSGPSVYYIDLNVSGGGFIHFSMDGDPDRVFVAPRYMGRIPIDVGKGVLLYPSESTGKLQYLIDNDAYSPFVDGKHLIKESVAGADHDVYASFTYTKNTYSVALGFAGDGSVRLVSAPWRPLMDGSRGDVPPMPFDAGTSVRIEPVETGSGLFQFLLPSRTDGSVTYSDPSTQWVEVSGAAGESRRVDAHFTAGESYDLYLSVAGSVMTDGRIGVTFGAYPNPTIWYKGSTERPIHLNRADSATVRAEGAQLRFLIRDYVPVPGAGEIALAPGNAYDVRVSAYFADPSTSYSADLSTIGPGIIEYKIGNYEWAEYSSAGDGESRSRLDLVLDVNTGLKVGAMSCDGHFMYFIYNGGLADGSSLTVSTSSSQVAAGTSHSATARFSGRDAYAVELSSTLGGSITYRVDGDPEGEASGFHSKTLFVDRGSDIAIGQRAMRDGTFVWYQFFGEGVRLESDVSGPLSHQSHRIEAVFSPSETFDVVLGTSGSGSITLTLGEYGTLAYKSQSPGDRLTVPVSREWASRIGYAEDGGGFRYFDVSVDGSAQEPRASGFRIDPPAAGSEYLAAASFSEPGGGYSLSLSREGLGRLTFRIGSGSEVSVESAGDSPYLLRLSAGESVEIAQSGRFQYFEVDGDPVAMESLSFSGATTGGHSVAASFSKTAGTHALALRTVGSGYVTLRLDSMGTGKSLAFSSGERAEYVVQIDTHEKVVLGGEGDGEGRFVGIETSLDRYFYLSDSVSMRLGSPCEATAYFTDGSSAERVEVSTIGDGDAIIEISGIPGSARFRSSESEPSRAIYMDSDTVVTVGRANGWFNAFVSGGAVEAVQSKTYDANGGSHSVAVWFSGADPYEALLSTSGGEIEYSLGNGVSGKYSGDGWSLEIGSGEALSLKGAPGGQRLLFFSVTSADGQAVSFGDSMELAGASGDSYAVRAVFAQGSDLKKVAVSHTGQGYVAAGPEGFSPSPVDGEIWVEAGATVCFEAVAAAGSRFEGWAGDAAGKPASFSVAIESDYALSASFGAESTYTPPPVGPSDPVVTYTITASSDQGSTISPSGSVSVRAGRDATFEFSPREGWELRDVIVDGASIVPSESGTYTFSNVRGDHSIEVLSIMTYSSFMVIHTNPDEKGSIEYRIGGGAYVKYVYGERVPMSRGDTVSVRVTPDSGYRFLEWRGTVESESAEIQFTVSESGSVGLIAELEEVGMGHPAWRGLAAAALIALAVIALAVLSIAMWKRREAAMRAK
jgi:hypothetical protein